MSFALPWFFRLRLWLWDHLRLCDEPRQIGLARDLDVQPEELDSGVRAEYLEPLPQRGNLNGANSVTEIIIPKLCDIRVHFQVFESQ